MRSEAGLFLVDGPVLLAEALGSSLVVRSVYVEVGSERESIAAVVSVAAAWGVAVREVRAGSLAKVLDLATPQDVVAVVEQPHFDLDDTISTAAVQERPILVLVDVADPGNVGTLVRSAEASGCGAVVLVGDCADLFNPKTVRATAGAIFRVPASRCVSLEELAAVAGASSVPLVGTVGSGGSAPEDVELAGPVAIVVGSEAHGLSDTDAGLCCDLVTVPMEGEVESLNAAVAGSIVVFEAARQTRGRVGQPTATESSGGAHTPLSHNVGPSKHDQAATGEAT